MTIQEKISISIWNGKHYADDFLEKIVAMEASGEDVCECKNKLILLNRWNKILEDYLATHFDSNGSITPDFDCLSSDQIEQIMSGIKEIVGNNKYPISHYWILDRGVWDSRAYWRNTSVWHSQIPLV